MDRLAVCSMKGRADQLVLVLSDPQIESAGLVVAAPLMDPANFPSAAILNPVLEIGAIRYVLATEQLAAIRASELGPQIAALVEHEYIIANAINRLFFGI